MHGRACKQYMFRSRDTATFSDVRFDENPFTCQCEKEEKRFKDFKFCTFICCFKKTSDHGSEAVK